MAEEVKRAKAHIQYHTEDGKRVPGVTTILGSVLAKPALKFWSNKLGLSGIDVRSYVDALAEAGKLAHEMVACHLQDKKADTSEASKVNIDRAENAFLSYLTWEKGHKIEPLLIETPLVSEKYHYGGTMDCYCKLDGIFELVDLKTSKAIYGDMLFQLAAYRQLLRENGHEVQSARILRIGRDESEGFEERIVSNLDNQWEVFSHCLAIYDLQKRIKREGG